MFPARNIDEAFRSAGKLISKGGRWERSTVKLTSSDSETTVFLVTLKSPSTLVRSGKFKLKGRIRKMSWRCHVCGYGGMRATYLEVLPATVNVPDMAVKDGKFTEDAPIPLRLILPFNIDRLENDRVVSEGAEMNIWPTELRSGSSMEVSNGATLSVVCV